MSPEQHDKTFIATFAIVLGILGAFTFTIIFIANSVGAHPGDAASLARVEERIKPVGEVVTDASRLLEVASAAPARAPMTGPEVVTKVCGACHGTGVLNAPKIGDKAAWAKLKAMGVKTLVASSIKGKNQMPPRGGDASLSEAELQAAIEEMLKETGL
ncbi:MAG: c-type cytochrome [Gammaproteobacteria bacterium]